MTKEERAKQPSEEIKVALSEIAKHFDAEDRPVRERQIRLWKKMEYYWSGFQRLWWSEVAHDWRVFDVNLQSDNSTYGDAGYYDKPINVFRAFLETIIAALSATVPLVKCIPDDANNPSDVATAKGGTKISELIYKHNDAPLLWTRALWVYCTQGMVAAYNYPKEDVKYGTVEVNKYEDEEQEREDTVFTCPQCGNEIQQQTPEADEASQIKDDLIDEYMPGDDDVAAHDLVLNPKNDDKPVCAQCLIEAEPSIVKNKFIVTRLVGVTQKPKTRQCIEVYGGLYIKVPNYVMKQEDTPYLMFNYETHYSNIMKKYPHLRGEDGKESGLIREIGAGSGGAYDPYERWGRLSTQYFGEYPINTPTVRNCWFRPWAFEVCPDPEMRDKLYKKYPDGVKVVFINELFAEAENESLDDCWTLTYNPLSEYLHFDPHGILLTSIQEITNDLVSLTLQTIEHGIPQTFADPSVLNFEQYRQTEATPGAIYEAKPKTGKAMSDAFYEVKTATLSQEVQPFSEKIFELGQFVSSAQPSLYGGNQSSSSRTAAQYAMSRAQSLQRLQTPWKMLTYWWKNVFGKVIPSYIKTMLEDERLVKEENGNFINILISKAEMDGKIGSVELEADEQLPVTWSQKRDVIMNLLQMGNPEILQAMGSPENLPLLAEALGLVDFNVPGESDREKQFEEIGQLLNSKPMQGPPDPNDPSGQPQEVPSVMPEPLVDNHGIEGAICREWLVSEAGRQAKIKNPDGYKNILLHMKAHMQMLQGLQQAANPQPSAEPNNNQPPAKPNPQPSGVKPNGASGPAQPTIQ